MESSSFIQPSDRQPEDQDEHKSLKDIEHDRTTPIDSREEEIPCISVSWSLDPIVHSYSSDVAPRLRLILTSHAEKPLTIYNESLSPGRMLAEGKFCIFDLTSNLEIEQRKARFCDFEPPSKVQVPLREQLFHTLHPEVPLAFETAFGGGKHAPKALVGNPESVSDLKCSRMKARGVDGLEPGHHYRLGPGQDWGFIRWWEFGEKEEVMNPSSGRLDGRRIAYRRNKNPHHGIYLDKANMSEIDFWCTI